MSAAANPQTLLQSWNVPELQQRLRFLLFALLIFVVCTHIPAPGIDPAKVAAFFQKAGSGNIFNFIDLFSGGAMKKFSIIALGVMPYINASIMMQLLVAVDPKLKEIQQEGDEGRKKISKWTRYLGVALAFLQGVGMMSMFYGSVPAVFTSLSPLTALFSVVGGTCFLMWLADEVSQKGVGNGMSIIITIGIVSRIPATIFAELQLSTLQTQRMLALLVLLALTVVIVAGIVFIQLSVRKIPIQYARRQIGRRIYGGQSTYLPMRVTQAGVIPIIFAVSVLMVPPTLFNFVKDFSWGMAANAWWGGFSRSPFYSIAEFLMVFVFTFVYTAVTFNTQDIADNLKKNNGFIPGIRPGKPTFDFLDRVLHRVTFFGGLFLGILAILPGLVNQLVSALTKTEMTSFYLGGTSLLIVVGVALDTVQQMQAHMVMRHYSGFNK
jgi:preprotein translocase subunit SecY